MYTLLCLVTADNVNYVQFIRKFYGCLNIKINGSKKWTEQTDMYNECQTIYTVRSLDNNTAEMHTVIIIMIIIS